MALPLRVIGWVDGVFSVIDPRAHNVTSFDIISYTWGALVDDYDPGIPGVTWPVSIRPSKLDDIRRFMQRAGIQYLWADCVCINQSDAAEKAVEIGRMYDYYRSATTCHILVDMADVWDPQGIVDDLKFVDHVLGNMRGASLAAEAVGLTQNLIDRLASWGTQRDWAFDLSAATVRSAGVDLGVLNCYATCIRRVRDLFDNAYFSRVWTFQEMILGKNITIWGLAPDRISCIGAMHTWMDLATDAKDKAIKLFDWIENCRFLNTATVNAVLLVIADDVASLSALLQLAAQWKGDAALLDALPRLPDAMRAAWRCDWTALEEGLAPMRNLFVLGRGLGLGAAQEAALKFKETCGLHAEAYSAAEVKHGPMALVGPGFPVLIFAQPDETEAGTLALADEFRARGAQVWLASRHARGDTALGGSLPVAAAPHPACAPLLLVQSFYRAVNALSLQRGHDPDAPPHLNKVTETV
jgi:hypothetical protein